MKNVILRTRAVNFSDPLMPIGKVSLKSILLKRRAKMKLLLKQNKVTGGIIKTLFKMKLTRKSHSMSAPVEEPAIDSAYSDSDGAYQSVLFLLSCASVEKYCMSPQNTILKVHDEKSFQSLFKRNYEFIRETYHRIQPANLLYIGGDIIAINNFEFPSTETYSFQMFNYAGYPDKFHISRAGDRNFKGGEGYFSHYLNAEVRLYGHAMTEEIWTIGDAWFDNWINYWEYEQDLWNAMFRAVLQNDVKLDKSDSFSPNSAFGYQLPINEIVDEKRIRDWNRIPISSAKLVHLHSSRGVKQAVKFVQEKLLKSEHLHL